MIQLGQTVKDSITGVEGVVVGTAQYLTGCQQACVQPRGKEDDTTKVPGSIWIDEDRLIVLVKGIVALPRRTANGCDVAPPTRC